jgi:hypothetical protein
MTFVNRLPRLVTLIGLSMLVALLPHAMCALTTSTVQGTVYRADGKVASGTLLVSWPAFTTSANEAVAAGNKTVAIGSDGWVSLGLAPNAGATPAGTYYTAVYHLNDGTTSTEYWVVPTSSTVGVASVRAQVMPATIAMQTVSKQYVDSSVANVSAGLMQSTGGIMNGPLTLSGDPSTNLQAATKHYVDQAAATNVSKAGDVMTGALTTPMINGKSFATGMTLQQAINAAGSNGAVEIPANYTGTDTFTNPNGVTVKDLRPQFPQDVRSVKEFGAQCTGQTAITGTITSGSNVMVTSGANASWVGRYVVLQIAYTSYDPAVAYVPYVVSVTNSTHVVLSSNAPYSAAGANFALWQDDYPGIQAAINWAAANPPVLIKSVLSGSRGISFPAGQCFVSQHVNYPCVPMRGQGPLISTVQGPPGDDVFLNPDPTTTSAVGCFQNDLITNLGILVDESVESTLTPGWVAKKRWAGQQSAWANNPNGPYWSSGITLGAAYHVGDTTITLSSAPTLNRDWATVGFAQMGSIKVGSNVCTYSGTVGAVLQYTKCGTQGTTDVAASLGASVVPVNPFLYTDTTDYFPAWQIGNGAFVFEGKDASNAGPQPYKFSIENVQVMTTNTSSVNNGRSGVAVYSSRPLYDGQFFHNTFNATFGTIFPFPAVNTDLWVDSQATMDNFRMEDSICHCTIPYVTVSGTVGFYIGNSWYSGPNLSPDYMIYPHGIAAQWMHAKTFTTWDKSDLSMGTWISHYTESNTSGTAIPANQYPAPWAELGGFGGGYFVNSTVGGTNMSSQNYYPLLITGNNNKFLNSVLGWNTGDPSTIMMVIEGYGNSGDGLSGGTVTNLGANNIIVGAGPQYSERNVNYTVGRGPANVLTHDAVQKGNDTVGGGYSSLDDLWWTPNDAPTVQNGLKVTADKSAPVTHEYVDFGGSGAWSISFARAFPNQTDYWNFPYTKGVARVAVRLRSGGPASQSYVSVNCGNLYTYTGTNGITLGPLSTTWQVFDIPFDATGKPCPQDGTHFPQVGGNNNTTSTPVQIAYLGIVPQDDVKQIGTANIATANIGTIVSPAVVDGSASGGGALKIVNDYNNYQNSLDIVQKTGGDIGKGIHVDRYGNIYHDLTGVNFTITRQGSIITMNNNGIGFTGNSYFYSQINSNLATGTPPLVVTSTTPVANLTLASVSQLPAIASTNLSDSSALARVASPAFTGTVTAPTLNATTGLQVNGVALASTNLSDTSSIARLSSSNVFTAQQTAPNFVGVIGSESDITFSATPTFSATVNLNYMSLTGNVTSSTLAAGKNGQSISFVLCQDATGSRTFTWPSTVRGGMTIGSTASKCSSQMFIYTNALSKWIAVNAGITNE